MFQELFIELHSFRLLFLLKRIVFVPQVLVLVLSFLQASRSFAALDGVVTVKAVLYRNGPELIWCYWQTRSKTQALMDMYTTIPLASHFHAEYYSWSSIYYALCH